MPTGAPDERVVALGPPRHACHACGSCCTGWRVKVAEHEHERIGRHAAALDVADPIVDGTLRTVAGACVFLGVDRLCRIHAAFGGAEKPAVCQVFPRLAIEAGDAVRIGVDPGCSSTWRSFVDGPELDFPPVRSPRSEPLPPELVATERELIRLCRLPGMTLAQLTGLVANQPGHAPKLPPGLTRRFLAAMKGHGQPFGPSAGPPFGPSAGGLDFFLTHEDAGPLLRADLEKAANFLRNVDATRPPKLVFSREASALVLETLQRTLFLRLGDAQLPPLGKFVLQLAGAIVCAYVYHRSDTFGRALAAWSRLSRLPDFWVPFIPDADAARALMTGVPA